MMRHYTLEYWKDKEWLVGRIREIPGIFSQGATLEELEKNILDAYREMMADQEEPPVANVQTRELAVEV